MFKKFFGKRDKPDQTPPKEVVETRGLEVVDDDPDTTWGLWESAVEEQNSHLNADPLTAHEALPAAVSEVDFEIPTQRMPLEEKTLDQRKDETLARVDMHHHRVANTIRSMWGYKECGEYLNKLIMDGDDGMGHNRIGFNQEAVDAMLVLLDLHEQQFGTSVSGEILGFGDLAGRRR